MTIPERVSSHDAARYRFGCRRIIAAAHFIGRSNHETVVYQSFPLYRLSRDDLNHREFLFVRGTGTLEHNGKLQGAILRNCETRVSLRRVVFRYPGQSDVLSRGRFQELSTRQARVRWQARKSSLSGKAEARRT